MSNKEELKKTRSVIQSKSHKLSNALNGNEYNNLIETISNNWEGEEKDKLLKVLNESIDTCKEEIRINNNKIQSKIDSKIK